MSKTTPFIKRLRTQGGTFYAFCSSLEDVGLNISERNNIVKMSHYALLNIPSIDVPDNLQQNRFNVLSIPGAFQAYQAGGSIKDGRILVAESFQNYALNLETNILDVSSYNPALNTTISERVFWKWLKETGAIRWQDIDTSAGKYWKEETVIDACVGYSSVVKCIGTISAGAVRTDTFGTYNETYILVPTSFGKTPVYFKQVEDDNYYSGLSIVNGATNIKGRETYLYPHPDALDFKAYYDLADSSSLVGSYTMQYDDTSSGLYIGGWWWTAAGLSSAYSNSYFIDPSIYLDTSIYNVDLQYYYGSDYIKFKRSKVDCMSIEYDLDKLKTIFVDPTLTFDKLAIEYAEDDSFDFNTVLVYYSVYNKALDKVLATNLLGVLFLDPPSGNTTAYPLSQILLPSITKLQSGATGFGTSYSFRLNIKSDYMLDDTQAIVTDTTASQQVLEDFTTVFDKLNRTLAIINQHTGTINYISEQYLDITSNQTNILNQVNDLQYTVNDIARDITGTENALAMFAAGDDPIVDSSIYMSQGKLGFFTNDPKYPAHFDVSVKVKDLIIEHAVRDGSGDVIIGYGSPIQIGSSTNNRSIIFYSGHGGPILTMNSSNNVVFDASITFKQTIIFDATLYNSKGYPINAAEGITKSYTDGSLNDLRTKINTTDASIIKIKSTYVSEASIGTGLVWTAGKIYVDVSVAGGTVTSVYVDGSLSQRDTYLAVLNASTVFYATNVSVGTAIANFSTNASVNTAIANFASNASVNTIINTINVDISILDSSVIWLTANKVGLSTGGTFTGTVTFDNCVNAPTVANAYNNDSKIATTQFVQSRFLLTDTSVAYLNSNFASNASVNNALYKNASLGLAFSKYTNASLGIINRSISLSVYNTSIGNLDTSIKALDASKANILSPTFVTSFGMGNWMFTLSGSDLILKYNSSSLFKFTFDGSILLAGTLTQNVTL